MKNDPISISERATILDVLRGFALLGVFMDNIFGFSGWGYQTSATRESFATWPADGILGLLEIAFIKGKFYSLFSLLFGIGFSIILIRNEQKGNNPIRIFYRRLFFLALFGLAHCLLLWEGDILLLYALLGCLLPLFRKCSDRTLLIWVVVLVLSPILIDSLKMIFHFKTGDFLEQVAMNIDARNGVPANDDWRQYLYRPGSGWEEWRDWQSSGFFYRYSYIIESNRIPKVLGAFLLGFWAGRKMIFARLENHIALFRKLRRWGLIIGIPMNIALALFEINVIPDRGGLLHAVAYALGVLPLSLAYVSWICLYWQKTNQQTKWKWLAPMGRMALTNYLMQTMLGILIFYGIGFGFGGNVGPAIFFPIALAVYAFQVLYSNTWFRYFNYGPFEWIWRMLTYWKKLPLKKK